MAKDKDKKGLCLYFFGVPVWEGPECAANRQHEKTARTEARADARKAGAGTQVGDVVDSIGGAAASPFTALFGQGSTLSSALDSAAAPLASLFGSPGASGAPTIDPMVVGGAALALGSLYYLSRRGL